MNIIDLGMVDYAKVLSLQKKVKALRANNKIEDTLLIVEHPPVLTLGCSGNKENILLNEEQLKEKGIEVYKVNRGGDVTYHGPGQIVGYPILHMNNHQRDIKGILSKIKDIFIRLLRDYYGIQATGLDKEHTGVWIENDKITAIGISISRRVTMHGFAFNINTNLDHFKWINPCGFTDRGVTSLKQILGYSLSMDEVKTIVIDYFSDIFGAQKVILYKEQLEKILKEAEDETTRLA